MSMTTALQNALIDGYFATERFMSLHTESPDVAGSYSGEVSDGDTGYARQSLAGKMSEAVDGFVTNTVTITFPTIAAIYGIVTHFGVGDAASAGTMGLYGIFTESSLKGVGQAYQFPPGALRFQFR